jgi:uncharacterized protein (DUF433 family)
MTTSNLVRSEIRGGTPCFAETRVPVKTLREYIEGGPTLDVFLEHVPTATREQVVGVLEQARERVIADARAA